jgi:hypothetical protein
MALSTACPVKIFMHVCALQYNSKKKRIFIFGCIHIRFYFCYLFVILLIQIMEIRTRSMASVKDCAVVSPCRKCKREILCDTTVFGVAVEAKCMHVTELEVAYMKLLCSKRGLPEGYSRRALILWCRVKACYHSKHHPQQLLIALHITLKWDSQDLAMDIANTRIAKSDWPNVTRQALFESELTMCKLLNWRFR